VRGLCRSHGFFFILAAMSPCTSPKRALIPKRVPRRVRADKTPPPSKEERCSYDVSQLARACMLSKACSSINKPRGIGLRLHHYSTSSFFTFIELTVLVKGCTTQLGPLPNEIPLINHPVEVVSQHQSRQCRRRSWSARRNHESAPLQQISSMTVSKYTSKSTKYTCWSAHRKQVPLRSS
jgi:hypothetical protein